MPQGPFLRKYGVESKINFTLFEVDGVDFRTDAVCTSTDCVIMKNEGAEATCANTFVDEGQGYSLTLAAGELEAARVVVYVVDSATKVWLDESIVVETYGNASAMHAFDLGTAMESQTVGTTTTNTDMVATAPTAIENRDEMDSGSTALSTILTSTGQIGTAGAGLTDLGGMSTGMITEVNTQVASALSVYTVPTKTEMDTGHALLATASALTIAQSDLDIITGSNGTILSSGQANYAPNTVVPDAAGTAATPADVNAQATSALSVYAGPTKAEMDTGHALLSTASALTIAQTDLDTVTGSDGTTLATAQGNYAPNVVVPDAAGVAPTAAEINAEVATALNVYAGPTKTEMTAAFTEIKGATWSSSTDTLEDIRDKTEGITKNASFSNFEFLMVDATDHATPETGLTVTGTRSIDGGAFAGVTGAIAEVGSGIYQIDLAAADTNGDVITYKFASTGAADTFVTIKTVV
jgi:hypothetical protein